MGQKSASERREKGLEKGLLDIHYGKKKKKDEDEKTNTEHPPPDESNVGKASNNGTYNLSDTDGGIQSNKSDS